MSRVCQVSGKKPMSGNRRSHSLRATRRKWNVNLQKVHVVIDGKQYLVRQKSLSDTKMPPSWLLSLESAPIEYSEVSDDG